MDAKREFKKHYKKAMQLKEGGKAWQREIDAAAYYKEIAIKELREKEKQKYYY